MMKVLIMSILLTMGALWPAQENVLFTNSVNVHIGLQENVEVRISWGNPPLNTTTDEMRVQVLDSNSNVLYDQDHNEAVVDISTAGWAKGTYSVVCTLTGFEEVDSFEL